MIECKECGKNIPIESKFCGFCGGSIAPILNQIEPDFNANDEVESPKGFNNSRSQAGLLAPTPKFEVKPILQLFALLVAVGVLLVIIWK